MCGVGALEPGRAGQCMLDESPVAWPAQGWKDSSQNRTQLPRETLISRRLGNLKATSAERTF